MTSAGLRGLRQDLDQLFREGSLAGASDGQLLERFIAQRDAIAFEALVARHRDLVLHTCHDLLGDAAEAEEAFQATALILLRRAGSVRQRDGVGAWLHRVACRVARRSRAQTARRRAGEARAVAARAARTVPSADSDPLIRDELRRALHEEIDRLPDRYRQPVILCLLEGMTQEQVAARLGWSEGSVRGRLARGRARLRARLTRRGISLAALVAALGESETVSAAVQPFANVLWTRSAIVVSSALIAFGGMWLALAARGDDPPQPPAKTAVAPPQPPAVPVPEPEREVLASFRGGGPTNESRVSALPPDVAARSVAFTGQVLDPAGKGVAGARVSLVTDAWSVPVLQVVSGADGAFRFKRNVGDFWRNFAPGGVATPQVQAVVLATHDAFGAAWVNLRVAAKDSKPAFGDEYPLTLRMVADRPIEGRILDREGRPVAGASVRVDQLYAVPRGDLSPIVDALRKFDLVPYQRTYPRIWPNNLAAAQVFPPVTTGADGRFTLKGVGRERQANLSASEPGIAPMQWTVLNRDDAIEATQAVRARWPKIAGKGAAGRGDGVAVYGPAFELRLEPAPTIHGTVRDAKTGEPVPDAMVLHGAGPATTDDRGQYRIVRGDRDDQLRINVRPPANRPFLGVSRAFDQVPPTGELTADFTLPRAVLVAGRAVEQGSGKPMLATRSDGCHGPGPIMAGRVWYQPLPGNAALDGTEVGAFFRHALMDRRGLFVGLIEADGEYHGAIPPGPGVLLVEAMPGTPFMWTYSHASKESDGMHRRFPYARLTQRDPDDGAPGAARDKLTGLFGPIALEGFVAYRVVAPAADDEAFDALIRIPVAPTRRVRFVDPNDQPVRGATVIGVTLLEHPVILDGDEVELLALDGSEGRRVAALSPDGRFWAETTVRADSRDVLSVRMRPSSSVIGRLVDDRGEPVDGVFVSAQYLPDEPARLPMVLSQGPTDADGRFRVNGIMPDHPIRIEFWRDGAAFLETHHYRPDALRKVVPNAGQTIDVGTVRAPAAAR